MDNFNEFKTVDIADLLFGSFIRYDRLYEMTKYAFYGKTDSNKVNIFIDVYSIVKSLYSRGPSLRIKDSYAIASCIINLGIHLRAYFETRHNVYSKVFIIYGGARPKEAFVNYYKYNEKNILAEDSDFNIKNLVYDNLEVIKILCPYLFDIFCIIDMEQEFSVLADSIIDSFDESNIPNIIYSKEPLAYQLVACKSKTFLYRPKKKSNQDASWVVTKSTIFNAYRNGELSLKKMIDTTLHPKLMSVYQSISGLRSRSMNSIKNANTSINILEKAVSASILINDYNSANSIFNIETNPFERIFDDKNIVRDVTNRFAAIDLQYQSMLFKYSSKYNEIFNGIINLYDPQTVRDINDKYFQTYPLDLNRV